MNLHQHGIKFMSSKETGHWPVYVIAGQSVTLAGAAKALANGRAASLLTPSALAALRAHVAQQMAR